MNDFSDHIHDVGHHYGDSHHMDPSNWIHNGFLVDHTSDFYLNHFSGTFHHFGDSDLLMPVSEIQALRFNF